MKWTPNQHCSWLRQVQAICRVTWGGISILLLDVQIFSVEKRDRLLFCFFFLSEFHRAGFMQTQLLTYALALLQEISQTLACNRHHSMDQQLCRWLLLRFDCLPNNRLVITQEQIANLLGVRRAVISEVASNLRANGFIKIERGQITLLDRAGLEERVCECYALIKKRFEKIVE